MIDAVLKFGFCAIVFPFAMIEEAWIRTKRRPELRMAIYLAVVLAVVAVGFLATTAIVPIPRMETNR